MSAALSSWSRRRAAVAAEAEALKREAEDAVVAEQQAELAEKTDAEILEELGLPDPDALVMGDDFKAFMVKTVPQHLRKRALRSLWRSNPVLACVDGLNDYDDDYLTGSTGQGPIKTSYQVGKGMLYHLLEMERQAARSNTEDTAVDAGGEDLDEIEDTEELPMGDDGVFVAADAGFDADMTDAEPSIEEDEMEFAAPAPRRMQFRIEGKTA
ncbi:DUF3306 domain-containing protein [Sulfitobacter sp. HGT1]|uniref:DUF3306 domain-containing protein n=1 Tax=Sulfitobacter sp. HGT1 TaxID=2735435 RepID=UPI00159443E1|nr:DUF3306 domain-containing protein [Sulfitobacter sp. HGT1]